MATYGLRMRSLAHEASSACKDAARAKPEHLPEEEADADKSRTNPV